MSAVTHTTSLLFCSAILVASAAPQDDEILLVDFEGTGAPLGKKVEIAPGVMMPSVNLGPDGPSGSVPKVAVPAWFKAGGVGIDIENQ